LSASCERCAPCVEQLSSEQERRERLSAAIAVETEPLVTLTHLLRLCRDEHRVLWEHRLDAPSRARVDAVLLLLTHAAGPGPIRGELPGAVRAALVAALEPVPGVPTVVVAHALAGFLDELCSTTFWASFSRRSPYQPAVGDPVPLDNPDLRSVMDMQPTSPPWRLARRLDETRHVRLAGAWATGYRVVFDYSRADALTGIVTGRTTIAVLSPNVDLGEFDLGQRTDQPRFPVAPEDEPAQRSRVLALVEQAAQSGATIVVLPELAVSAALAEELKKCVRPPSSVRLLVAGSQHVDAGDGTGRRNTALAWLRGSDVPLLQDKHSPADSPVVEDLHYEGWPELRVHVSADGWHLALAVCRDLLNPGAVHALAEAGVNLLLAPAMSDALLPFGAPGAQLVGANQAIVAVANGPADWASDGRPVAPAEPAMFGHPGLTGQTRLVHRLDASPGIALLDVRSALVRWTAGPSMDGDRSRPTRAGHEHTTPTWARHLARHLDAARHPPRADQPGLMRRAAVLVLLSEGTCGLQVLITRRSAQLRHHPGEWVLPGGSTEAGDIGPVGTALREAREEIGIDPGQVTVLGALPTLALDDGDWLLVPVVGWSALPVVPQADAAEVAAWANVALADLASGRDGGREGQLGTATGVVVDLLRAALARSGRRPATAHASEA
jgi:8-oxo-dGTP pyrophosphatase MutT (NUDIX family)/predicted amidohydrolase